MCVNHTKHEQDKQDQRLFLVAVLGVAGFDVLGIAANNYGPLAILFGVYVFCMSLMAVAGLYMLLVQMVTK
jgi:hypothetical protein